MLFIAIGRHTAETCPGGAIRPDKDFMIRLGESIKNSGAELVEGYIDGPGHTFYLIIEADTTMKLNNAVEPMRLVGEVTFTPVMRYSEGRSWAKSIDIQK